MENINYATYLERLKNARRELRVLECLCLQGKVDQPVLDGDANEALAQYAMIAVQTVDALHECGCTMGAARDLVGKQRWPSRVAGQGSGQ